MNLLFKELVAAYGIDEVAELMATSAIRLQEKEDIPRYPSDRGKLVDAFKRLLECECDADPKPNPSPPHDI